MTPILSATILRTQSDARLVALAREGYERAFEAIVERYRKPLQRYCRRMLSDSRSEDAVQQTFLKAWSALEAGDEVKDLKPWLYRIARNNSLDALKKAGYDYDELSDSLRATGTPAEDVERRTVMRQTLTGLAALPGRQRKVLLGLAVEGKSRAEVAAELGISDGAVRQLAHRARLAMRAAATALTPLPLVSWAAAFAHHDNHARERIAELAAGGGAAGVTGVLVKGGAVIVAAGVIATAPNTIKGGSRGHESSAAAKTQRGAAAGARQDEGLPASSASALRSTLAVAGGSASAPPRRPARNGPRPPGDEPGGATSNRGPGGGDDLARLGGGDHSGPGGGDDRGGSSGPGSPDSGSSGGGDSLSGPSGSGASGGGSPGGDDSRSGPGGGGDLSHESGGGSSGPGPG